MKIINFFLVAAVILIAVSCGKKDDTTTTNTTNTNNTNTTIPPNQTQPDTMKKNPVEQVKTDSLKKQSINDSVTSNNHKTDAVNYIKDFLKEQYSKEYKKLSFGDKQFSYDSYDLIGDGRSEYFIMLSGNYFCGTGGCTMFILNADFTYNTKMLVVQLPLYVSLKNMTNKWRDLYVKSGKDFHKLVFSHTQYPSNPSIEPGVNIDTVNSKAEILSEKTLSKSSF